MKDTKRSLLTSVVALLLCFSMLLGTTYAWFTDSAQSAGNVIQSGNLDIEMYWSDRFLAADSDEWKLADEKPIFTHDNWEPGYTDVKYVKIKNAGNLSFKWKLSLEAEGQFTDLADVIDVYYVDPAVELTSLADRDSVGTLAEVATKKTSIEGVLLPENETSNEYAPLEAVVAIALHMDEEAGNKYQGTDLGCGFSVSLIATQFGYEEDSFNKEYDKDSDWPVNVIVGALNASANVDLTADNKVATGVNMSARDSEGNEISAEVPAGVGATKDKLTLTITTKEKSDANIVLNETEAILPLDVHIDGVAEDNEVVIKIKSEKLLPEGLNLGNHQLYHVEDGKTVAMTLLESGAQPEHNNYEYDPTTGDVVFYLKSFSEVALVADTENAWEGKFDYTWYDASKTNLTIANADQLAAFGAIVGGMAKDEKGAFLITYMDGDGDEHHNDSFEGKTVKLVSDINLGDKESENNPDLIFYPIGYWNSEGTYEKTGTAISSGFYAFEGTFDGNGNTISNFYQNTWEMKGDHDWYDATLQYFRDGMGLFGKVYGGTVKNLTVDNFSSDGEIATTGVIAAYADSKDGKPATFENIAITKCNPRVYNIGNGGIVGCAGWYSRNEDLYIDGYDNAVTFRNITVDQTNKISALWGSWGVSCAGILGQYYPNSNCGIKLENCHVAAIIDVNNDVCSNYQYYWYRYAGMFIGTIRANTKDANGYEIADTTGVFATDCTYTMGNWNEYWYCEIVANSIASYTHDHQFSRLDNITDISEIKNEDGTWKKEGHFALLSPDRKSVECYHIFKNSNGELYQHFHDVADESNPNIYETFDLNGDGELNDLKEDRQCYFIPFNQLLTGLDMGIKAHTEFEGIKFVENGTVKSTVKFNATTNTEIPENGVVNIGDLFTASGEGTISSPTVQVYVSPVGYGSTVSATYSGKSADWENGTLTFSGAGSAKIVITDHFYCTKTALYVTVGGMITAYNKFETKFTGDFLYRVGNQNAVKLDSLFKAKDGITIGTVDVTVEAINGTSASGTYTSNATWTNGTIQFSGTGIVKVTITDNDYCTPTELILEVVDAVNATGATSATANNVVLLNDCGFGSLEVSGGYTLFGNGFTMTCSKDSAALDMGYSFVTLNNGILDNVQIVCPNFDYAVLYKSNMTESGNRSETTDRTRYFNVKSGVMVSGNSQILNSRISGARAAVNVTGGNCLIDNSRIELGAVASLLVGAANSLTLRDVTLVQEPTASTYDSSKNLMGFSVLFICDADGNTAPMTIEGTLIQNAWVDENDKQYVPSAGQSIVSTVLGKTEYLHDIDGDGTKESLNLGFAYMPESLTSKVNTTTITDNRTNKNDVPYDYAEVSILNGKTYVYSYKNTNGTADSFKTKSEYKPNKYGDIITVSYADTSDGLTTGKTFGTDGWVYELNVDLDKLSGYALDFSKLSMSVNGVAVTDFKVNGNAKPTSPVAVTAGGVTYTLTATVNGKEYTATYKVTGTETSKESPSKISGPTTAGFGVAKSYGSDWSGAADVLTGVKIKYWSVAENKYVEFDFSNFTVPGNAGKLNGTNSYWEYTHTNNDFTLKVTNTVAIHSGKSVYGMPIRGTDGKLYFTISSTTGYVGSGTTSRAITMQYEFTDNNGGEKLTFNHTFNISYSKDEQYSYSDLSNSGKLTKLSSSGGSDTCVTPDTLITLADGTQVRVDSLTGNEELLVWNMETGMLDKAPIMFIDSDPSAEYEIVHLYFSDGADVKVIYEHGFWDYDLNKYVYLDRYAEKYIGHTFAKQNGDSLEKVQLVDVVIETEITTAWSPVTEGHLCYFVNGMLSMPGGVGGLFNIFEVDAETMTYDYEQMQKDIETYGLYTYEELNAICPLSEEMFEAAGGAYLKISIAKGNLTVDELIYMITRYSKFI